jgi:hypothetical protein
MWKLLKKDWLLNRKTLWFIYLFWSAVWLGLPLQDYGEDFPLGTWAGLVSAACAFIPVILAGREDKFKAGALVCSLPVTRRAVVTSRYIGGWLVALAGASLAVGAVLLLSLLGVWTLSGSLTALPVPAVVVIGITLALTLPFALRFGVGGLIGLMVALQLAGMVGLLATAMFGSSTMASIESAIRTTVAAVRHLRGAMGAAGFATFAVGVALLLNLASWRLSILVYSRREF